MMDVAPIFPPKLQKLWDALELRFLVLLSLFLQVVLISTGSRRKYSQRKWVAAILWLSYLSADSVATLALGVLSQAGGDSENSNAVSPKHTITVFWAPFLLMHLGGPDTITAYALADNELWSRHLLGLMGQVFITVYIFLRSFTRAHLNLLWMVVFVAGVVKYGERSWVLFSASKDRYRDSVVSRPDPGPDYSKFMDELVSREREGYRVSLGKAVDNISSDPEAVVAAAQSIGGEVFLLQKAYSFFGTFKKLFADLILSFQDRKISLNFFNSLEWNHAFSIVEIELGLVFDLFYTKSSFIFSPKGVFLRLFSCLSTIAAFIAFLIIDKSGYPVTELVITYILLLGAILLELYAVLVLLLSDRMMIWLRSDSTSCLKAIVRGLISLLEYLRIVSLLEYLRIVPSRKRWSNSMGQYNVLDHCLNYTPNRATVNWYGESFGEYLEKFDQYLEKYLFWRNEAVTDDLKKLIFDELRKRAGDGPKKSESSWRDKILLEETDCFKSNSDKDKILLEETDCSESNSDKNDEVEFDQSLLVWHMATDICYYTSDGEQEELKEKRERCRLLSNYMVHLLIMSPFMLPSGIGQIRFQDTWAEAAEFFKYEEELSREKACKMLSKVVARFKPSEVKGDRSKSFFFDGQRLAQALNKLDVGERWDKISQAWVEMLTFAAGQCSWSDHAEKLSQGGELLTHVWLLMAHFGMTDQFQISQGYIRAKLELK